jgi:TPR repeat protein
LKFWGLGLCKDVKEALEWFNKFALDGNINALYQLGTLYEEGEHIERDVSRPIKLYKYLTSNRNLNSQVRLAIIYEEEKLVDQNLHKAEKHYQFAENFFDDYQ